MEPSTTHTFYRAVKKNPPGDKDYVTNQERKGDPPPTLSPEERRSWDALSFYDSEEGVRRLARQFPGVWRFIARYEIPENTGLTWEETIEPGHYDIRGDKAELKRYLGDVVPI